MTTYNAHYSPVFTALGYPNASYDGNFQWTGDTPSAGIIAAVLGLPDASGDPSNSNTMLSLYLNQKHASMLALQAAISGAQWSAFLVWLKGAYEAACSEALTASTCNYALIKGILRPAHVSSAKDRAEAALTAAGLTSDLD